MLLIKKQNFCYTRLNIGITKIVFGLNKINCPKNNIIIFVMNYKFNQISTKIQTKIQPNKLQIRSKKLTTKQSIIKTYQNLKSLKFLPFLFLILALLFSLSSYSLPLLFFLSTIASFLAQASSDLNHPIASDLKTLRCEDCRANCPFFFFFFFSSVACILIL